MGKERIRMDPKFMTNYASKYNKPDVERLGLFIEMPYMNGKGYVSPFPKPRPDKGANMYCEANKIKDGTGAGYFDKRFKRAFEGDCIKQPAERMTEEDATGRKKKTLPPFLSGGCVKPILCPGHPHGTFDGVVEHFSPELIELVEEPTDKKKKKNVRNFVTNPVKKGGPGYVDICLSKYPEHEDDPYRPKVKYKQYGKIRDGPMLTVHFPQPYFDDNPYLEEDLGPVYKPPKQKVVPMMTSFWCPTGPGKRQGGCHAGLFNPFPEYKTDRDKKKEKMMKKQQAAVRALLEAKGRFAPHSRGLKSLFTPSIMSYTTDLFVNEKTYRTYKPMYCQRLIKSGD